MRTHMPALAILALVGLCCPANAQCPELTQLRSKAPEVLKYKTVIQSSDRCETYIRFSIAWDEVVQYANDHRESCGISSDTVSEFEKRHREAVTARDNVCTGRPIRPYPADLIQR